jgi:hypothetical protein
MMTIALAEIEETLQRLPPDEQLWLISRLAQNLQHKLGGSDTRHAQLAAMAEDEDIQRELQAIDKEFRHTEGDGLADW